MISVVRFAGHVKINRPEVASQISGLSQGWFIPLCDLPTKAGRRGYRWFPAAMSGGRLKARQPSTLFRMRDSNPRNKPGT